MKEKDKQYKIPQKFKKGSTLDYSLLPITYYAIAKISLKRFFSAPL